MKIATRFLFLLSLLLFVTPLRAQVKWDEPQIQKVRLKKPNRKVVKFSGKTKPNSVIKMKNNTIRLYLDDGKARNVGIPQKDKVQFPLTAAGDGSFEFQLYLPTTAVELAIQVKSGTGKWRTSTFRYRVPGGGYIDDYRAEEQSFRDTDEQISKIDRQDNYYSRKYDKGLIIGDGKEEKEIKDSKLQGWVGLGFSYFNNSINSTGIVNVSASDSSFTVPTFRLGADYHYSDDLLMRLAIRSTSGSTDSITGGTATVTGKDYNWFEGQLTAAWFLPSLRTKSSQLGLDLGLQLQRVPFFRERPDFANYSYFDNSTYNLQLGVLYQKKPKQSFGYGYEGYARYLYPISTGDAFDMNTSFPLMFEFGGGVRKRFTPGMSFGLYGQMHYYSMKVKYSNTSPTREYNVDLDLILFTVDGRIIIDF